MSSIGKMKLKSFSSNHFKNAINLGLIIHITGKYEFVLMNIWDLKVGSQVSDFRVSCIKAKTNRAHNRMVIHVYVPYLCLSNSLFLIEYFAGDSPSFSRSVSANDTDRQGQNQHSRVVGSKSMPSSGLMATCRQFAGAADNTAGKLENSIGM